MMALLHDNRLTLDKFEGIEPSNKPAVPHFCGTDNGWDWCRDHTGCRNIDPATHRKVLITDGKMLPDYIALDP